MFSFSGQAGPQRKVDLRGKSRGEETREQVLERTRLEREKRKRAKLEHSSATVIQSFWRGRHAVHSLHEELRATWALHYEGQAQGTGDLARRLAEEPSCLGVLLQFADSRRNDDAVRIAAVCTAVLQQGAAGSPSPFMAALAAVNENERRQLVYRLQRLALLAVRTLVSHRWEYAQALSSAKSSPAATGHPATALVNFIVRAISTDTWSGALGTPGGQEMAASLLLYLMKQQMFPLLRQLLEPVAAGRGVSANGVPSVASTSAPAGPGSSSSAHLADQLVTQATARWLSLKGTGTPTATATAAAAAQVASVGIHHLLCTPNLWAVVPSLAPVARQLCRRAAADLAPYAADLASLAATLPADSNITVAGGRAGAAAALLSNILQAGGKLLAAEGDATAARNIAAVLSALLSLLPLRLLLAPQAGSGTAEDTPSTSGAAFVPSVTDSVARLAWPSQAALPAGLSEQLSELSGPGGRELLKRLVHNLLPFSSAEAAAAGAATPPDATGVRGLCFLVWQLSCLPMHRQRLLLALSVSAGFVSRLWFSHLRALATIRPGQQQQDAGLPLLAGADPSGVLLPMLAVCPVFSSYIATSDLEDFYTRQQPLALAELCSPSVPYTGFLPVLRNTLWQVLWLDVERSGPSSSTSAAAATPSASAATPSGSQLRVQLAEQGGRLLGQLYDRNFRRQFCPPAAFIADGLSTERFMAEAVASKVSVAADGSGRDGSSGGAGAAGSSSRPMPRVWMVLRHAPSMVPFQERAKLFQREVEAERASSDYAETMWGPQHFITVRRSSLLFDGFDGLNNLGPALKGRVRIQFVDQHGIPEAGIDGGGLFKDFMEELVRMGFNPEYGLFEATSAQQLFPSPAGYATVEAAPALLEFLGRMLGKALWEGILLELPFAGFFLKKVRGGYCDLNDLPSLDPEVYRNLMTLRNYQGDVSDLALTFTVDAGGFGQHKEEELKAGGRDTPVTNDNVIEYVHRVADFRLNAAMARPVAAFVRGLYEMVRPEWLRMFNEEELQMLISGSEEGVDVDDLATHVNLAGGYHPDHPVIHALWEALRSFTPEEQRAFLKFVTACSRPPLLGFAHLEPQLCVQMSGSVLDPAATERLPTAATCMNLLKLPPYRSVDMMRDKLRYAITSGAGFDLS